MDNAVRINAEQFRFIYKQGFKTWAQLYFKTAKNPNLPAHNFFPKDVFARQPAFPHNLSLSYDGNRVIASGSSAWGSQSTVCDHSLPDFELRTEIDVTRTCPTLLSISETAGSDNNYASYFSCKDNYLSVLILAWAYVLSARWAELMPGTCSLQYTDSQAIQHDRLSSHQTTRDPISIDVGNASPDEFRWWAAVLAPGQGWVANMALAQGANLSPWSICLNSNLRFLILCTKDRLVPPHSAASFSTAREYLNKFCLRYNLFDQSHAALASVLLFPCMGGPETLQLPLPRVSKINVLPEVPLLSPNIQLQHDWVYQGYDLDKLLTLSCYSRGIRPMLLSVFYESNIECNAVTPWLQGALAAINNLAGNNSYILGRMCMERAPGVACLWLGSTILGLQRKLLQDVRFGNIPIDLHCAAWSGTVQTFLQLPVSNPLTANGYVSRADECRLLFLSQKSYHSRVPICQWKPFGATSLDDVDIEVRVHATCVNHGLQYRGFFWNCTQNQLNSQRPQEAVFYDSPNCAPVQELDISERYSTCYNALNRENEVISENATRSILGWLRFEGRTRCEKDIWSHDWFDLSDSDDEDMDWNEVHSEDKFDQSSMIQSWVLKLNDE